MYIDGALDKTFATNNNVGTSSTAPPNIGIAYNPNTNITYFNGSVAVAQAYNTVLTAQQIQDNFNALKNRYGVSGGGIGSGGSVTIKTTKGARISGVISGAGNIIKTGTDTLILQATNTFSGTASITTGAVEIKNAAAFGTASGTTTVASGATVQIEGSSFNIPEPITISGDGVVVGGLKQGAIKNIRNANTWSGAITLAADARIVSGTLSHSQFLHQQPM